MSELSEMELEGVVAGKDTVQKVNDAADEWAHTARAARRAVDNAEVKINRLSGQLDNVFGK